ncbi:DUF1801 domain-containing protein [Leptospira wolffii]|uniref:DUF1801 domain-containing protein n=1 Tax=Leptospira wolffii TaxID=409998 RepID=UPI0010838A1A|nr:DUF1801 domain-containing protein [Leptospira wolffii]TGL49037.1 DUF1801 domain-containing protein [Leptospira wolffii]
MPTRKKKTTPRKAASKSKEPKAIKYTDKSPGQPELVPIFEEIKRLLLPYAKGSIRIRGEAGGQINLVSEKEILVNGKKKPEVYFASALVQKGYVGFYFMPVYAEPEMKRIFQPELLGCLKGKSCFHIKKKDPILFSQIRSALELGYQEFKKKDWVD